MGNQGPVLVTGGTGLIGDALSRLLEERGRGVSVLTRHYRSGSGLRRYVTWAPDDPGTAAQLLAGELEGAEAVVNLAGEPIASGRWSRAFKRRIRDSRLNAAKIVVNALGKCKARPRLLVNASAVGYYGDRNEAVDEAAAPGSGFLAELCRDWEARAAEAEAFGVRVVRLRIGLVLSAAGGALPRMLRPFRLCLGGPLGSGRQWVSWIHIRDLAGMILWLLDRPDPPGVVNGAAPNPVSNREFSRTLAKVLGRPCLMPPAPAWMLRLALGEMSSLLLEGQPVVPRAAHAGGFSFRFPELEPALRDLLLKSG